MTSSNAAGQKAAAIPLTAEVIESRLKTRLFGTKIYAFDRLGSTNNFAKRLAREGAEAGTLVVAEEQTRGRGRLSSQWYSPPGTGLWLTLILPSDIERNQLGLIPILSGVSVAQTLESVGLQAALKWPNDVLINGKKVCGILTESEFRLDKLHVLIVGIGLNVNQRAADFPEAIRHKSTSLCQEVGKTLDRVDLLVNLIQNFESNYKNLSEGEREQILTAWRQRCPFIGQNITVKNETSQLSGIFESIDENGHLHLRTLDGKLQIVTAGESLFKETGHYVGGD